MAEKIIDTAALIDSLRILLWDRSKTREELAELVIGLIEEAGRECDPESLRPSGRWEKVEDFDGDSHWRCSACGCEWHFGAGYLSENGSYYCPNCGAKMEDEK